MESLSPFPWGSCIPYNMPVYPGARRFTANTEITREVSGKPTTPKPLGYLAIGSDLMITM